MRPLAALATGLMAVALCAGEAVAAPAVTVTVEAATLDARGQHLVLDAEVHNGSDQPIYLLLPEALVFTAELLEASCPGTSAVLAGAPAVQLGPVTRGLDAPECSAEPRPTGPEWRRGILRLEPGGQVRLLVAAAAGPSAGPIGEVRFGLSWAAEDELPRRLARQAWGAEGLFLSSRPVAGRAGGGRRGARLFAHRASSDSVQVHLRSAPPE